MRRTDPTNRARPADRTDLANRTGGPVASDRIPPVAVPIARTVLTGVAPQAP